MPTIRKLDLARRLQCSPALISKMLNRGLRASAERDDGRLDLEAVRWWIGRYRRDALALLARLDAPRRRTSTGRLAPDPEVSR